MENARTAVANWLQDRGDQSTNWRPILPQASVFISQGAAQRLPSAIGNIAAIADLKKFNWLDRRLTFALRNKSVGAQTAIR